LAQQISLFMTGSGKGDGSARRDSEASLPFPNGLPVSAEALPEFDLAEDRVLVPWNGNFVAAPIAEVVKRDLRLSDGQLAGHARTDCFFSVAHARGEGSDEWLPEEEARIAAMSRLERELGESYEQLGAFSLAEALRRYFSPELAASFLAGQSPEELQRIQAWVIYTRRAGSLKNPAGFLRSRLESGEFPPEPDDIINGSK
jgi:hypothetical protein